MKDELKKLIKESKEFIKKDCDGGGSCDHYGVCSFCSSAVYDAQDLLEGFINLLEEKE